MNRFPGIVALTLLFAIPAAADDMASARGAEIIAPFKMQLKEALMAGLAQGPSEAIGACKLRAPEIARALSVDGVVMGRSSHRLRNPRNAAPDWVSPVMQAWVDDDTDRTPRTVDLPGDRVGYVEPILMQPVCLTCHGDVQDPSLAETIAAEYPEDRATGFELDELRGVFWAEFPADGGPHD
jgi:hypothetical protein